MRRLARHQWRLLAGVLLAGDVLGVLGACGLAVLLVPHWVPGAHTPHDVGLPAIMAALAVMGFAVRQLYTPRNLGHGTREFVGVLHGCAYASIATVVTGFVRCDPIPRLWTAVAWTLAAAAACAVRLAVRRGAARLRARGLFVERTLLVGADQHGIGVARQLGRPGSGIEVVGVLDDYEAPGTVLDGRFTVLGTPADLARVAADHAAHDAVVVPDALAWETMRRVLADAVAWTGGRVHLAAGFTDLLTTGVHISERNHVPLLTLKRAVLTPMEAAVKRGLDCALSVLLLAACGPVLLATVLRLRARGIRQPLQRTAVCGLGGTSFEMLTFDPRGTSSGFVRKLPALLCVLRGDLSIVGTRPIPADGGGRADVQRIRPGLTGHWRETDCPTEQATLDLAYIRGYSLWTDLHVLWTRSRVRFLPRRSRQGRAAPVPVRRTHGAG